MPGLVEIPTPTCDTTTASADEVVCAQCGHPGTEKTVGHERTPRPWCATCGCLLVVDAPTGDWVSFAERAARDNEREAAWWHARATAHAVAGFGLVAGLVAGHGEGWGASLDGGTITVHPPVGPVEVTAYLRAHQVSRWGVQVVNVTRGVGAAIFAAGGAHAAEYDTALRAAAAAVTRLYVETGCRRR